VKDILYYDNDTLYLYDSPLEQIDGITAKIFEKNGNRPGGTSCWRGFRAEWKIIDDILYLHNVYECFSDKNINGAIEQILGKEFKNGLMEADWVKGVVWCGKDIVYEKTLYISIFEHEYKLDFDEGVLKKIENFSCISCEYSDNDKIMEFVINELNPDSVPPIEYEDIIISAYIQTDKTGKPSKIKILNSTDTRFNSEITKALYNLPCLPTHFYKGQLWDVGKEVHIRINKVIFERND
jgi:hypothetical protein